MKCWRSMVLGGTLAVFAGCALVAASLNEGNSHASEIGNHQATLEPEIRSLETLLFSADRMTPEELALLGETFGVPHYTVTAGKWKLQSPDASVMFIGRAFVGDEVNTNRSFGQFAQVDQTIIHGVVVNFGRTPATFVQVESEHIIEVEPGAMLIMDNDLEIGVVENECDVTCSGSFCACCNYGANGKPTCRCVYCPDLGEDSCDAGGPGAVSCIPPTTACRINPIDLEN